MTNSQSPGDGTDSMGWEEAIALKRKLSSELKDLTEKLIDIDRNKFHSINNRIRDLKSSLDPLLLSLRQTKSQIDKDNNELMQISDKITQSKNFLSMMESRLPSESEPELLKLIESQQIEIDGRRFRSEREKNEIVHRIKDASMKVEAIKAVRTIKEEFEKLNEKSIQIAKSIQLLTENRDSIQKKIGEANTDIDRLYESKRVLASERESLLQQYDQLVIKFDSINARLDQMAEMRKKQRQEYGYRLPDDTLFKVREEAKKKLAQGSKLSLDELKLLYTDKD